MQDHVATKAIFLAQKQKQQKNVLTNEGENM
jgi:hypothetical protein